ncbi:MAG TPA: ABC transporter permease subunit [Rhodothermia bacterium]|nr:ABC transporter permease subunit [Rhodothermia bacterium]
MRTALQIIRYELSDIVRSRWVAAYFFFFLGTTLLLFQFGGGTEKALLGLSNVVLIVVPLVSVLLGTMYIYNAREFIELLLAQPVRRRSLYWALYFGLALPLAGCVVLGLGLPFLVNWQAVPGPLFSLLMVSGMLLTAVFVAFGLYITARIEDRVKGLGAAILVWALFALLYDAGVLLLANRFAEYPLETPLLVLTVLNPVDLARVLLLLRFDAAALMGYTGAVFETFFGSAFGVVVALGSLVVWILIPTVLGRRAFERKDF